MDSVFIPSVIVYCGAHSSFSHPPLFLPPTPLFLLPYRTIEDLSHIMHCTSSSKNPSNKWASTEHAMQRWKTQCQQIVSVAAGCWTRVLVAQSDGRCWFNTNGIAVRCQPVLCRLLSSLLGQTHAIGTIAACLEFRIISERTKRPWVRQIFMYFRPKKLTCIIGSN